MKTALTDEISWLKYLQFDLIMRHDMNAEAAKNYIINNARPLDECQRRKYSAKETGGYVKIGIGSRYGLAKISLSM